MKAGKAQGVRRKASGEKTWTAAAWEPDAGGSGAGPQGRSKAARLIPMEELRPLAPPGTAKKMKKKCPDCRYCQGCSQDRCRLCRGKKKTGPAKLSQAEQIALYDKINRPQGRKPAPQGRP